MQVEPHEGVRGLEDIITFQYQSREGVKDKVSMATNPYIDAFVLPQPLRPIVIREEEEEEEENTHPSDGRGWPTMDGARIKSLERPSLWVVNN